MSMAGQEPAMWRRKSVPAWLGEKLIAALVPGAAAGLVPAEEGPPGLNGRDCEATDPHSWGTFR